MGRLRPLARHILHHHRLTALAALLALAGVMTLAHVSPWSLLSLSSMTAAVILVLQSLISNAVAGVVIGLEGRFPPGTHLTVEGFSGTVTSHQPLALLLTDDAGNGISCPHTKLLADILLTHPPHTSKGVAL